jgi:deazaflavin-dependent oxidoreductase (nitroreductase family)
MSTPSTETEQLLRQGFKKLNRLMLWHWRLGMGPYINFWPGGMGRFIVLVHTGRKSGRTYRNPVNYAEIEGDIYVTAGFGKVTDWYRNIMANPRIEAWLPDGRWQADVEDITGQPGQTAVLREVLKGSGFVAYLAGINPNQMSDADLEAATAAYRLLRIRRVAPLPAAGGPGDLLWLWPLLTMVALVVGLAWPRGRRG